MKSQLQHIGMQANKNWDIYNKTKSMKPVYPIETDFNLPFESNADWSRDANDIRSNTRSLFKLLKSGGFIICQTRKEAIEALFSCQAKNLVWEQLFKKCCS